MMLNAERDSSESGTRYGLLSAVESVVANVFLPTIESQSCTIDKQQNGSVRADVVNSLSSFVRVLASMLLST